MDWATYLYHSWNCFQQINQSGKAVRCNSALPAKMVMVRWDELGKWNLTVTWSSQQFHNFPSKQRQLRCKLGRWRGPIKSNLRVARLVKGANGTLLHGGTAPRQKFGAAAVGRRFEDHTIDPGDEMLKRHSMGVVLHFAKLCLVAGRQAEDRQKAVVRLQQLVDLGTELKERHSDVGQWFQSLLCPASLARLLTMSRTIWQLGGSSTLKFVSWL